MWFASVRHIPCLKLHRHLTTSRPQSPTHYLQRSPKGFERHLRHLKHRMEIQLNANRYNFDSSGLSPPGRERFSVFPLSPEQLEPGLVLRRETIPLALTGPFSIGKLILSPSPFSSSELSPNALRRRLYFAFGRLGADSPLVVATTFSDFGALDSLENGCSTQVFMQRL